MSTWKSWKPPFPIEFYEVGDIFQTTREGDPKTLLGYGTWSRIENRMLVGAGDSYNIKTTGGEATHTLTTTELPNVSGSLKLRKWGTGSMALEPVGAFSIQNTSETALPAASTSSGSNNYHKITYSFGSNGAHNNMPPYYAVYIWLRTA